MNGLATFASNNALPLTMMATCCGSSYVVAAMGNQRSHKAGAGAATAAAVANVALGLFIYQFATLSHEKQPFQATVQTLGLFNTIPPLVFGTAATLVYFT